MTQISLTIIENDKLIANLLKDFLNSIPNFKVDGLFFDGASFLESSDADNPSDILLVDLKMPNMSGIDLIEELKRQEADSKIIVISSFYDPNYLGFIFKLGVSAFIPKEIDKDELIQIIQTVYDNGYYFDQNQMKVLQEQMSTKVSNMPLDKKDALTSREIDVLKLICHQLTAKEIGEKLFISKKTVETHKSNLLLKTGAKNISGLIIFAVQNGFIDPDEILL